MFYDVIIIGSGIAALNTARNIDSTLNVALITKTEIGKGSSVLAQGGIASVSPDNEQDSFECHIKDTLNVGGGLCHDDVVELCIKNAPEAIKDLVNIGVHFSLREINDNYDLTKEGGHSHRRVYHSGDITGESIVSNLIVDVKNRNNIKIFENNVAINLITDEEGTVFGVYVLDNINKSVK
ncbi:MAG: FAD-binding protein, partial [bacterium]